MRPPHPAYPPHSGLRGGRHCDPADHPGRVVSAPTSNEAWVQTTLPLGEGGGVFSASDVAPVARLAGVMQLIAREEPLLGCDRQLVVPMATKAGLLDALNARLPPGLEPMASRKRVGNVE